MQGWHDKIPYRIGGNTYPVLQGINMEVNQGEFIYADCSKEYLGYYFLKKSERKRFIDKQVELLDF